MLFTDTLPPPPPRLIDIYIYIWNGYVFVRFWIYSNKPYQKTADVGRSHSRDSSAHRWRSHSYISNFSWNHFWRIHVNIGKCHCGSGFSHQSQNNWQSLCKRCYKNEENINLNRYQILVFLWKILKISENHLFCRLSSQTDWIELTVFQNKGNADKTGDSCHCHT